MQPTLPHRMRRVVAGINELLADPRFNDASLWVLLDTTISNGQLTIAGGSLGLALEDAPFTVVSGATYRITVNKASNTADGTQVQIGATASAALSAGGGLEEFELTTSDTSAFNIGDIGTTGTTVLNSVSVKRIS